MLKQLWSYLILPAEITAACGIEIEGATDQPIGVVVTQCTGAMLVAYLAGTAAAGGLSTSRVASRPKKAGPSIDATWSAGAVVSLEAGNGDTDAGAGASGLYSDRGINR